MKRCPPSPSRSRDGAIPLAARHPDQPPERTQQQPSNSRQPQPASASPRTTRPVRVASQPSAARHRPDLHLPVLLRMTITSRVKEQLFETNEFRPIRIAPSVAPPQSIDDDLPAIRSRGTPWSADEHNKFLDALAQYPYGPWRVIAEHIGTRTARQAMSHAQKYRQKIQRRKRDVIKQKAARRKEQEQEQSKDARCKVPASIEEQPRPTKDVANTNNNLMRAPASSRYELPSLQMSDMQAYVDASVLPFGTFYPSGSSSFYDYTQYAHTYAPVMAATASAGNIPTESYDPQASYYYLPSLYAASANADAATGHGNEHAEYSV